VFPRAGEGQTPFRIDGFYRIVSILTKNSMLSTKKLYAIAIYPRHRVGLGCGKVVRCSQSTVIPPYSMVFLVRLTSVL
jgi:hypothetical protein